MATTNASHSMFGQQTLGLLKQFTVLEGIRNDKHRLEDQNPIELPTKEKSSKTGMSCLVCQVAEFDSLQSQRDHFKLDWHRYNVKQKLMNKSVIAEEDFEETVSGELSSISGSESENSDDDSSNEDFDMEGPIKQDILPEPILDNILNKERSNHKRNHPKLFLLSDIGTVFTVYRSTVFSPRNIPEKESELIKGLKQLPQETLWMIIMTAGGHFAAAVFDGESVVAHKTFHRYTVRAKRGTSQGIRDNQQGIQTRSAGASLRRYNEAALFQEVQDLLKSWSEYLLNCHKIFIRIPTYNKAMIFGGKTPPLSKNDPRIRTIPFATRRPTFKEIKRVHEELSRVQILGSHKDVLDDVINELSPKKPQMAANKPNDIEREDISQSRALSHDADDNTGEDQNELTEVFSSTKETNSNSSTKKAKKKKKNSRLADQSGQEKISAATKSPEGNTVSPEHHIWNRFYCAIVGGNIKVINQLLSNQSTCQLPQDNEQDCKDNKTYSSQLEEGCNDEETPPTNHQEPSTGALRVLNERWGESGSSLLHVASRTSQTEIIYTLLHHGADPCVRDDGGKTPYDKAKSKEVRDQFRTFMAEHPEAFDYSKSHIPSPLTQDMKDEKERKEAEKKKAQRKAKKQRAKEQKENEKKKQEEEIEQQKLKIMSEREKRAQAAEKRFAKQLGKNTALSCDMCTQDLAGRVPFERLTFKYCSTDCVRKHRLILENKGR